MRPALGPIIRIISSTNASVILDPFMGSGTTAIAARALKRDYIGIEISPQYCEMAEQRIKRNTLHSEIVIVNQSSLFPIQSESLYKNGIN